MQAARRHTSWSAQRHSGLIWLSLAACLVDGMGFSSKSPALYAFMRAPWLTLTAALIVLLARAGDRGTAPASMAGFGSGLLLGGVVFGYFTESLLGSLTRAFMIVTGGFWIPGDRAREWAFSPLALWPAWLPGGALILLAYLRKENWRGVPVADAVRSSAIFAGVGFVLQAAGAASVLFLIMVFGMTPITRL